MHMVKWTGRVQVLDTLKPVAGQFAPMGYGTALGGAIFSRGGLEVLALTVLLIAGMAISVVPTVVDARFRKQVMGQVGENFRWLVDHVPAEHLDSRAARMQIWQECVLRAWTAVGGPETPQTCVAEPTIRPRTRRRRSRPAGETRP